jgi:hypothetical protein
MTREEWITYHDNQAKKHGEVDLFFEKKCYEVFDEENGMFQYEICGDEMVMRECIGHLLFWNNLIPWVAKTMGCNKIVAYSNTEKPKRLERLYKSKAVSNINGTWKFERMVI